MTKVVIIGEQSIEAPKKKIEFVKYFTKVGLSDAGSLPKQYENIELISLDYCSGYDLMFAYGKHRSLGLLYLGHFNDGVVQA